MGELRVALMFCLLVSLSVTSQYVTLVMVSGAVFGTLGHNFSINCCL